MPAFVSWLLQPQIIAYLAIIGVVFVGLQLGAAGMVYAERKVAAFMQQRWGPFLVGPRGLLQPLADIVKLVFKEDLRPKAADALLFTIAPIISVATAYVAFAPVPFGADTTLFGLLDEPIPLLIADINVAVLVIFAVASMGVYGIVLAGWASNSKYSLLGGLRSSAQMISYELAYGVSLATVIMVANSMSLKEIVDAQAGYWWFFSAGESFRGIPIPQWNIFLLFPLGLIAFLVWGIAGIAETNRAPFDFPEAEQELVAGYHTEYSSMAFAMFFLAEYINMITVSAVATNLFLGGWHGPFLDRWGLGWVWFLVKTAVLLFIYLWLRWTLPRFRYDQLMAFGWKLLLPVATINLLAVAAGVLYFDL
jgi:NADH-quinone oxidoreductase subunit H